MDRAALLDQLEQVKGWVANAENLVAQQKQLISESSRDGKAATGAQELLPTLEIYYAMNKAYLDHLERELATAISKQC